MAEKGLIPGFIWRAGLFLLASGEGDQGSRRAVLDGKLDLVGRRPPGPGDLVHFSDLAECPGSRTLLGQDQVRYIGCCANFNGFHPNCYPECGIEWGGITRPSVA